MNHHVSTEDLSAYLDSELGYAEVAPLEAHCASCDDCGSRLAAMRRVVNGLGGLHRAEPPAALRLQIRREVQTAPPISGFAQRLGWARESLRIFLFPMRPALAGALYGLGCGLIADADCFDAAFFGISPREAVDLLDHGQAQVLRHHRLACIVHDAEFARRGVRGHIKKPFDLDDMVPLPCNPDQICIGYGLRRGDQ